MALNVLLSCGFEAGSWDFYAAQGFARTSTSSVEISTNNRHQTKGGDGGAYSIFMNSAHSLFTPAFSSGARWVHSWVWSNGQAPYIVRLLTAMNDVQVQVELDPTDSFVRARRGTGTLIATSLPDVFLPFTGYWLSVYCEADNSGFVKVFLNGREVLSFAGNTRGASVPGWERVAFRPGPTQGASGRMGYVDDIIVTDDDGGTFTTPLPECYGQPLRPVSVDSGNLTGTPETGADRYLNVASLPWDPDSCNIAAAPGDEDIYNLGGYVDLGGTVLMVSVYANALTEGVITQAELSVGNGGQMTYGAPQTMPSSPNTLTWARYFAKNPSTGDDWTPAALNALKAGVRFS